MKLGSLNEYQIQNKHEMDWLKTKIAAHLADMGLVLDGGKPVNVTVSIEMEQR